MARGAEAERLIVDLLNRAALATACDAFGVAEQALEMTIAYAKERVQFDRPIGSFQAVKHRCADMYIAVETARASLSDAIDKYDEAPADAAVAISRAKAYCCDASAQITEDAVEMHGGIGFTWEHDMHLYVKRARAWTKRCSATRDGTAAAWLHSPWTERVTTSAPQWGGETNPEQ